MIRRRSFIQGAGSLLLGAGLVRGGPVQAAPGGRLLYGYPAGAAGDELANGVLAMLGSHGGPRYHLENVEGRNTRAATERAKTSLPDGATLLQVLSSSFTLQPHIYSRIGFDPLTDFEPIALLGEACYSLTLGPVVPATVTDVSTLLGWLRDNPEYRSVGVSIYGTLGHLALRMLARNSDVTLRGQPYKGSVSMLTDLSNGNLAAAITVASNFTGKGAQSQLRSIGVTGRERLKYWPQVPTLKEQGFDDLDLVGWFGWFAPAGTRSAVTGDLRQLLGPIQASAEYRALQARLLMFGGSVDPQLIRARIAQDSEQQATLLKTYMLTRVD